MTTLRSLAFIVAAVAWTTTLALLFLPVLAMPRRTAQRAATVWTGGLIALARAVCGLKYQILGLENVPQGSAIIASKHQSAWDTLIFHQVLRDPVYVMKRELFRVPLVGWYMKRAGSIAIDRSSRVQALRIVVTAAQQALSGGRQVIVFPEGTRVSPGQRTRYQAGVVALYERCRVPVVPVALNSGLFWGRRSLLKRPGTITVEILPAIAPGLDRPEFLRELRSRIEDACDRLNQDAHRHLCRGEVTSPGFALSKEGGGRPSRESEEP